MLSKAVNIEELPRKPKSVILENTIRNFEGAFVNLGSCHKRQKPQAPTPQAPIRNRLTRKVANAKVLNRNFNLS